MGPPSQGDTRCRQESRSSRATPARGHLLALARASASEYFERQLPAGAVTAVIEHHPITARLLHALNPARVLDDLTDDVSRSEIPRNDLYATDLP